MRPSPALASQPGTLAFFFGRHHLGLGIASLSVVWCAQVNIGVLVNELSALIQIKD
jgi:hypothetical protein